MTKNKILLVFFALVFGFCGSSFADVYSDCENNKSLCLAYLISCTQEVRRISSNAADIVYQSTLNGGVYGPSIVVDAEEVGYKAVNLNGYLGSVRSLVESVVCSSNDTCTVDLSPLVNLLSDIYDVVSLERGILDDCKTHLMYIRSSVNDIDSALSPNNANSFVGNDSYTPSFWVNVKYPELLSVVSNFNASVNYDFFVLSNLVDKVLLNQVSIFNRFGEFSLSFEEWMNEFWNFMDSYSTFHASALSYVSSMSEYLTQYLPYLETIDSSLAYLATNEYFTVNVNNLSNYLVASSSAYKNSLYYFKPSSGSPSPGGLSSPYNNSPLFNRAVFADVVRGGFMNLITCLASVNNYLYWMYERFPTNNVIDLAEISSGLSSISNTLNRVDSYVLGDFSNQFYKVYSLLDTLVSNQLNSATNNFGLSVLIETNNIYTASNTFLLASIDSKLDVLDYIKILSDTPLADYSGDVDYYDYLTNLYINGSADSGVASTNWFERMEILLASLVFGDSDGTNDIPQGVEMDGVDSSTVETALSDFTYNQEFTGAITALDDTRQSFIGVLNGLHTSIKSVSLPASISIGLGGLDGEDTHNFEDMMHGHFQVSFNTGVADRFTIAVRAVTTISWVLLFFLSLWKSGFYLIRKLVYLYRLVTRLLVSVFTR